MRWAKAALTGGLLVLLATFAIGTENDLSTPVMGETQDCGPSISASWLVSGTPDRARLTSTTTEDERRAARACEPVIHESRVLMLTMMGAGGLIALVGWTVMVTRREPVTRTVTHARA